MGHICSWQEIEIQGNRLSGGDRPDYLTVPGFSNEDLMTIMNKHYRYSVLPDPQDGRDSKTLMTDLYQATHMHGASGYKFMAWPSRFDKTFESGQGMIAVLRSAKHDLTMYWSIPTENYEASLALREEIATGLYNQRGALIEIMDKIASGPYDAENPDIAKLQQVMAGETLPEATDNLHVDFKNVTTPEVDPKLNFATGRDPSLAGAIDRGIGAFFRGRGRKTINPMKIAAE